MARMTANERRMFKALEEALVWENFIPELEHYLDCFDKLDFEDMGLPEDAEIYELTSEELDELFDDWLYSPFCTCAAERDMLDALYQKDDA